MVSSALVVVPAVARLDVVAAKDVTSASTDRQALAAARKSNQKVLIESRLSESREVYATPDGHFEGIVHVEPQRVRRAGKWTDIDTTLKVQPDGSIAPAATVADLAFSAGGASPMVKLARMGRQVSLTWPGQLPKPVLSGDTARYAEVLPGVDLQLTATVRGYTELLVVKTPEAAQSPELEQLQMSVGTSGLKLTTDSSGAIDMRDTATGGLVFEAPPASMWDSGAQGTAATAPSVAPSVSPSAQPSPSASASPSAGARARAAATPSATPSPTGSPAPGPGADPADGPIQSSKTAKISVSVGSGHLTLQPDRELLAAADTRFPVYIDPQVDTVSSSPSEGGANLWVKSPGGQGYNFGDVQGLGFCDQSRTAGYPADQQCGSDYKERLFFRLPLDEFWGSNVIEAQFTAFERWAYQCPSTTGTTVQLYQASGFGKTSTWNSTNDNWQSPNGKWLLSRDVTYCDRTPVQFPTAMSSTDNITKTVSDWVKGFKPSITFMLKAYSETNMDWWKKFSHDAYLKVLYNTPPVQPDVTRMQTRAYGGCSTDRTKPVYTNRPPKLFVDEDDTGTNGSAGYTKLTGFSDPDGDQVKAQFGLSWGDNADGSVGWKSRWPANLDTLPTYGGFKASGTATQIDLNDPATYAPSVTLPQNTLIGWHARGWDTLTYSDAGTNKTYTSHGTWSYQNGAGDCYFIYDTSVPDPPTVTSTGNASPKADYPQVNPSDPDDPAGYGGVGTSSTFTLKVNDPTHSITKFRLGLNAEASTAWEVPAVYNATDHTASAQVLVTPNKDGSNFLEAQTVNAATTPAASKTRYNFRVNPGAAPVGYWKMDDAVGATSLADSQTRSGVTPHPATVNGAVTLAASGQINTAATLNGTTGYASTTGPATNTTQSLTVSAWARLTDAGHNATIVSQAGTTTSGFALYYSKTVGKWAFNMQQSDVQNPVIDRALSNTAPAVGVWTHLTGVYDSTAGQLRLYVNGELQTATAAHTTGWNAGGAVQIGREKYQATQQNYFPGDIDEVKVWDRALFASEAKAMATIRPVVQARWAFTTKTGTTSPDDKGAHPMNLIGGADITGNAWIGTGALGLTDASGTNTTNYAATADPVIDTAQSFTISAWAGAPARPHTASTAFSLPGTNNSAITVRYVPDALDPDNKGQWELAVPAADTAGSTVTTVSHTGYDNDSGWNLLTVTYDAATGKVALYVNGAKQAATDDGTLPASWTVGIPHIFPNTKVQLGATTASAAPGQFWPGQIDEVWAFSGLPMDDRDITKLTVPTELPIDTPPL